MNFWVLFQFLTMLGQAALRMATLAVGQELHTDELGIPPAYVNWQDGKQFTVTLHIKRAK